MWGNKRFYLPKNFRNRQNEWKLKVSLLKFQIVAIKTQSCLKQIENKKQNIYL